MKRSTLKLLLVLLPFLIASCSKKIDNTTNNPDNPPFEVPEGVVLNEYINALNNKGETKFELTVNSEETKDDVIKGNYNLVGDDDIMNKIEEGKLILYRDNDQFKDGKLLLVTKVHKIEPNARMKASFDATQVAMNFLFEKGDFNYSGHPNRTKLAVRDNDSIPGLFNNENPPVLKDFTFKAEEKNYVIHGTARDGVTVEINKIDLYNKEGASARLEDVKLRVNPTFDILCQFEAMPQSEREAYFEAMKDNGLITNVAVVANQLPSRAKQLGVISYTDFDLKWNTILEYKGGEDKKGDTKKIFELSQTLMVGPVPIVITTKGALRYEYSAEVNANLTFENDVKYNLVAGDVYDFKTRLNHKIWFSSLDNSTTSSRLLAVTAHGKVYYDQEVEIRLLGMIGPTLRLTPFLGAEVYYHQETGKPLEQNLGVYLSAEMEYAVKLNTFFWDDISIGTSKVSLGEHEFGRKYIYKLPGEITVVDGDNQGGPALSPLLKPVRVKVTDSKGNPLKGISVEFKPQSGGEVVEQFVTTDNEGFASTIWSPGYPEDRQAKLIAKLPYHFLGSNLRFEYISTEFTATVTQPKPIDPSGYTYKTIQLGNRTWTAENYKYGGITWEDNEVYGRYYRGNPGTNSSSKFWRIPTAQEYQNLIDSLGDQAFEVLTSPDGFNAKPYGYINETDHDVTTYSNPEFNNKAVFSTSTPGDQWTLGYYVKCLIIDFNNKSAYVQQMWGMGAGNIYQPSTFGHYNIRLTTDE